MMKTIDAGNSYGDEIEARRKNGTEANGVFLAEEIDDYMGATYRDDPAVRKLVTYHYTNWSRRYPLNDSEYTAKHCNRAEVDLGHRQGL